MHSTRRGAIDTRSSLASLNFGSVRVPWGDVQRLQRGSVDLPLGGGPDVLNGINARTVESRLVGRQGDSFVLIAELQPLRRGLTASPGSSPTR